MTSRTHIRVAGLPRSALWAIPIAVGLVAVLAGCQRMPDSTAEEQKAHQAVGQRLAMEVGQLIKREGRIVVITVDPKLNPTGELQLKPFLESIGRTKGITVAAVETLGKAANAPGETAPLPGRGLSAADFERILAKHSQADALVSLVGPPLLTPEQLRRLSAGKMPLVALTLVGFDREDIGPALKQLFQSRIVQLAVLPRTAPEPAHKKMGPFDRYYQIITAANSASLPN